jgi:TolA-binding protein
MSFFERSLRTVLLLAAASVLAGHTAPAAAGARASSANAEQSAKQDAAADKRGARSATTKRKPARLEVSDELAFTITEQTRISGEVRSQYDNALRLLEQERYERCSTWSRRRRT